MGNIKTEIDSAKNLTINIATGKISIADIAAATRTYLSNSPTSKVLWNLMQAEGSGITSEEFRQFIETMAKTPMAQQKRRIVFVVPNDLGFGLGRMSQIHAEMVGIQAQYHVTYDMNEAFAWLEEENNKTSG